MSESESSENTTGWHDFPVDAIHPGWHEWTSLPVREFDRAWALERARSGRLDADGKPHKYNKLDKSIVADFTGVDGVLSDDEARFWLGLCLDTPFWVDRSRRPTFEYFERDFDYGVSVDPADIVARCNQGQAQHMTIVARLLRVLAPYVSVLDALLDTFEDRRLAEWLEMLGPPPVTAREDATARVARYYEGRPPAEWSRVDESDARVLNIVPEPGSTRRLMAGVAHAFQNHDQLDRRMQLRLDPSKPLDERLAWLVYALPQTDGRAILTELREGRSAPNPREVGWFYTRWGPDHETLMNLVVRRLPTAYDLDVWRQLLHVRDARLVAELYPYADQPAIEPFLAEWFHEHAQVARVGLKHLLDKRGRQRAFAEEWLAELSGDELAPVEIEHNRSDDWRTWAQRHQTTAVQDEDIAVPTLGLDDLGRRVFDYGKRTITVEVVGHDELRFTDLSSGKISARIPPARASDDARKVAAVKKAWASVRPKIRAVFAEQADRLEVAMMTARRWPIDFWMSVWLEHPVLAHIARRTVWLANTEERAVALVPSLENDFHDARYEDVELPPRTTLTVAHPVDLDVPAWAETFADLSIVQPFPQLERRSQPLSGPGDAAGVELSWDTIRMALGRTWQPRTTGTLENLRDQLVYSLEGVDVGLTIEPGLRGAQDRRKLAESQQSQTVVEAWARRSGSEAQLQWSDWPARHRYELGVLTSVRE